MKHSEAIYEATSRRYTAATGEGCGEWLLAMFELYAEAKISEERKKPNVVPQAKSKSAEAAQEKRAVFDRLIGYRKAQPLGSIAQIEKASRKKLTEATVRSMVLGEYRPIEDWRALGKALDKLEAASDSEVKCEADWHHYLAEPTQGTPPLTVPGKSET